MHHSKPPSKINSQATHCMYLRQKSRKLSEAVEMSATGLLVTMRVLIINLNLLLSVSTLVLQCKGWSLLC